MKRLPDWTKEEFDILILNSSLSKENLSLLIPRRTTDAITVVRNGIHEFHQKGESSLLSRMMKDYIVKLENGLSCPICGMKIYKAGERFPNA